MPAIRLGYSRTSRANAKRGTGERVKPILEWVARNTSFVDVLSTEDDLAVYLYTGRMAVATSTFAALERIRTTSDAETAKNLQEIFDTYHPAFLLIGGDPGVRTANAFATQTPPLLRLMGHRTHVMVYNRLAQ